MPLAFFFFFHLVWVFVLKFKQVCLEILSTQSFCWVLQSGSWTPLGRFHPTSIHSAGVQPSFYRQHFYWTTALLQTWVMLAMVEKEPNIQNTTCYGTQLPTSCKGHPAFPPSDSSPIRHFLTPSQLEDTMCFSFTDYLRMMKQYKCCNSIFSPQTLLGTTDIICTTSVLWNATDIHLSSTSFKGKNTSVIIFMAYLFK